MQIIIVAGGGGSRLWPLSTPNRPKQFIRLVEGKSSLEKVYSYISDEFNTGSIWINTNQRYIDLVQETLPGFDSNHILAEPEKRDNFAAVSVQAALLAHRFGDEEPLIFTTSDEFFESATSAKLFVRALQRVSDSLQNNSYDVVTMGIKATNPNTNYGYVELKQEDKTRVFEEVVSVSSFREKPNFDKAEEYIESGNYVWNKFNPSFTYKTLKRIITEFHPDLIDLFETIRTTGVCTPATYAQIPKVSFDYAVMEKTKSLGITALNIHDWIDVGNWEQAFSYLPKPDKNVLQIEGDNNKFLNQPYSKHKKISFVGVSNLLVIETEDSILILDPKQAPHVKKAAEYFDTPST